MIPKMDDETTNFRIFDPRPIAKRLRGLPALRPRPWSASQAASRFLPGAMKRHDLLLGMSVTAPRSPIRARPAGEALPHMSRRHILAELRRLRGRSASRPCFDAANSPAVEV